MVARTPVTRDRVVDFLRAASIVAVVFGHWMIGIVWWQDGVLRSTSAVGVTTGLWLVTWFFQVMPIFFFVGGFSNLVSLDASRRRGDPDARFVKTRVKRLLRPSLVFFAIWSAAIIAMHLLDVGAPTGPRIWAGTRLLRLFLPPGAPLPVGPVVLTNPPFWRLFGTVRYDWFRGIGAYPKCLLGTDVEPVSNAYPPTVCFLLGAIWSIGAVMLLRPVLARWLERTGPWKVTILLNSVIMTLFLWHMTAYLFTVLTLWPLGLGHQHDSTAGWWLERPLWIGLSAVYLTVLVAVFGRFERPKRPEPVSVA